MKHGCFSISDIGILINGYDIFAEPEEAKRCIGYLSEIPPLYLDMTVKEYLEFAAELKKIPRAERENNIQKAMEMTKLEDVSQRMIKNLSKGYKQRVGLAQAVLGFPEIIILVESVVFENENSLTNEIELTVHAKKDCDIQESVFYKLAKEKLPILEMHIITKSLEDVFIELTQEGEK